MLAMGYALLGSISVLVAVSTKFERRLNFMSLSWTR